MALGGSFDLNLLTLTLQLLHNKRFQRFHIIIFSYNHHNSHLLDPHYHCCNNSADLEALCAFITHFQQRLASQTKCFQEDELKCFH